MLKELLVATAALVIGAGVALASDSPNDPNNGVGNDGSTHEGPGTGNGHPGGSGPGQSLLDLPTGYIMLAGGNGTEDPPGTPSGPQGPGQHGSPGPNGNSGP